MLLSGWFRAPTAIVLPLMDTLNANASPISPLDAVSSAVNFEVVFQPVLGLLKTYAAPVPPLPTTAPTTAVLLVMAADHPSTSPAFPSEGVSSALKLAVVFHPPFGCTKT